jgi:DNA-binding MarR family transcriptional regulator
VGESVAKRVAGSGVKPEVEHASGAWHRFLDVMLAHKEQFTSSLAKFDLNPPQAFLLRSLAPGTSLPMCHIASALSCDASNVTNIVDRLEARGLIERQPDPTDRRVRNIALTRAGARLRTVLLQEAFAPPQSLLALTPSELKTFEDLLRKVFTAQTSAAGCGCDE